MKFTKTLLASAIAFTITHADANDFTVSAVIKNETATFSKDGGVTGNYTADTIASTTDSSASIVTKGSAVTHSSGDLLKSETSARIFINGEAAEGYDLHAELRPVVDTKGANDDYKRHQNFTQQDYLRELYIDTTTADGTFVRLGKQQVVWGKADGAKFMDLINPTDYREMAQNAMDESRITVWALNAEKILDDGSTVQVVVSQPKENIFAGLNRNISTGVRSNSSSFIDETLNNGHDEGHAFILKGPDTITGRQNGFLNIVPDLGSIAGRFAGAFSAGVYNAGSAPTQTLNNFNDYRMAGFTVAMFEDMTMGEMNYSLEGAGLGANSGATASISSQTLTDLPYYFYGAVNNVNGTTATTGEFMLENGFQPFYNTNLADSDGINDAAFDYMSNTTFATFDEFVGAKSQYVYKMPDDTDLDLGAKFSKTLDNGANLSFAYSYNYDKNPIINLSWRDDAGNKLYATKVKFTPVGTAGDYTTAYADSTGTTLVLSNIEGDVGPVWGSSTSGAKNYGGTAAQNASSTGQTDPYATLRFEQTVERVHNIGFAGDFSVDTASLGPVVLRGEFVYTKDAYQPVIDKSELNIGNMTEALKMEKADKFKYVLGADVTVLTDMMLSAQFIQERNLDFVDSPSTCNWYQWNQQLGGTIDCSRYTASYASMAMSNGFQKDIENKEFYSLFLSKPFGESGEGRWNNILMLEEGGGRWNRFDVEYSLSNEVVGTFEVNKYWGDANSQFGQLENSSNVQVGLKYIIE